MDKKFIRTAALFGQKEIENLSNCRVAIFGVGGVGSYTAEALCRSGIGTLDIFDNDTVCLSNINRQLIATEKTVGMQKTDAAEKRLKEINSDIKINKHNIFYLPETANEIDLSVYDYIVDAVDTVAAKLELACRAEKLNIPLISIMGTGNKTDPTMLKVSDIYKTQECPLARVMRTNLKKRGVKKLLCVWSPEKPVTPNACAEIKSNGRPAPSSSAFVPGTAGLIAASQVIKYLVNK